MLGPLLLKDDLGARVAAIAAECHHNSTNINIAILREWLAGGGLQPVSWATLIRAMADAGQVALAKQITAALNR